MIVLAPSSVQEMADFAKDGFDLAFKYRTPIMILTDGVIGQMMEKVELMDYTPRLTDEELIEKYTWATTGKSKDKERRIITSLDLDSAKQEQHNHHLQSKYRQMEEEEVRFEKFNCEDADYAMVAYGSSARICQKAVELAKEKGLKVGLLRPITLFPFPKKQIEEMTKKVKGILSVEMSAGQMVEDVRLAANGKAKVEHFGRYGGIVPTPEEVLEALEQKVISA
jgi:2-oxoglutarate ferredoxin oxidoreductase subunit alpha